MATTLPLETACIGLDDSAWTHLSCDVAAALLRVCTLPGAEDRTYSSVQMLATPSGQNLYVRPSLSA